MPKDASRNSTVRCSTGGACGECKKATSGPVNCKPRCLAPCHSEKLRSSSCSTSACNSLSKVKSKWPASISGTKYASSGAHSGKPDGPTDGGVAHTRIVEAHHPHCSQHCQQFWQKSCCDSTNARPGTTSAEPQPPQLQERIPKSLGTISNCSRSLATSSRKARVVSDSSSSFSFSCSCSSRFATSLLSGVGPSKYASFCLALCREILAWSVTAWITSTIAQADYVQLYYP
mmetsp:Transcript_61428/g.146446  ORF Transcript_61428/g.146446 Transcript_61428/m.146446 type:complete len:231 (+) Transcript_61428:422-1114(+)